MDLYIDRPENITKLPEIFAGCRLLVTYLPAATYYNVSEYETQSIAVSFFHVKSNILIHFKFSSDNLSIY
jgi:hypothetical protein